MSISPLKITLDQSYKKIQEWDQSPSLIKKHAASRALALSCIPLEFIKVIFKTGKLLVDSLITSGVKVAKLILPKDDDLKELDHKLPTYGKLLSTAVKIMKAVAGLICTIFVHPFSPIANYKLHVKLGLVKEKNIESACAAIHHPIQPTQKEKELESSDKQDIHNKEELHSVAQTQENLKTSEQLPTVTLAFDDGSLLPLSESDLKLLVAESPYFAGLIKPATDTKLNGTSTSYINVDVDTFGMDHIYFLDLLAILKKHEINQPIYIGVLLLHLKFAHKYQIKKLIDLTCPVLDKALSDKKSVDFGTVCRFHWYLSRNDLPINPKIQETLGKYYGNYLASLKPEDIPQAMELMQGNNVEYLDFSDTKVTDKHLEMLTDLPLTALILRNCPKLTDNGVAHFRYHDLHTLDLYNNAQITDAGMQFLEDMPLTALNLWNCKNITDKGLQILKNKKLTDLELYYCKTTEETMKVLKDMPLKKLGLGFSMKCTDEWLANLKGMPLEYLDLQGCHQITDKGLEHIKDLPLKHLSLKYCMHITNSGLGNLKTMPLEFLDIDQCDNIKDDDGLMSFIQNFSKLEIKIPNDGSSKFSIKMIN